MSTIPHICKSRRFILLAFIGMSSLLSCATSRWKILTEETRFPHALDIISIAFTDPHHGWAINAAEIMETVDGGITWNRHLADEDKSFYSLMFLNQSTGWIVGTKKVNGTDKVLVIRTVDSGNTWLESTVDIATSNKVKGASGLQSVSFCDPEIGWAVGADVIIRSTDGGQTWEKQRSDHNEVLYGVQCISSVQALAVGQDGLLLSTEDGGKNWLRQDSNTGATLTRVRSFDGTGWILGGLTEKGLLMKTVNGVSKWKRVQLNTSETPLDIYINGQQGWIVGASGTILHTNDGGQSWQQEKSPTGNDLTSIFFLTPQQGWISGSKLTVLKLAE